MFHLLRQPGTTTPPPLYFILFCNISFLRALCSPYNPKIHLWKLIQVTATMFPYECFSHLINEAFFTVLSFWCPTLPTVARALYEEATNPAASSLWLDLFKPFFLSKETLYYEHFCQIIKHFSKTSFLIPP